MSRRWLVNLSMLWVFAVSGSVAWAAAADKRIILYPQPESSTDQRVQYPLKLLQLGLEKSDLNAQLQPTLAKMQQGRALAELSQGRLVDVVWSMTSKEREAELLPIRIPIYKGLIGWRIPLVMADRENLLQQVQGLSDLQKLVAGQGHDWPDLKILEANGLKVYGSPSYEGLFKMLAAHHFDYFPRSVIEIEPEFDTYKDLGLQIDSALLLRYPTAFYFFVNPQAQDLANAIESGLRRAIADGSFERLFQQHFGDLIQRLHLQQRRTIQLTNPLLPPQTPLAESQLWFELPAAPSNLRLGQ